MPVGIKNNKRRSLHITHNVKLADITKEALSRPRSWYLSGTANTESADPYTSVRKLFYDFNKTAFYGENGKENNGGNVILNEGENATTNNTKSPTRISSKDGDKKLDSIAEKNLRNSFRKLDLKHSDSNSTLTGSVKNDKNNNLNPIPVTPPKVPQNHSSTVPNFIQRTVFSSKQSDTASLKEESSSYADIYVPNSVPTRTSNNFLRRSYKRRSYDSSKFSAFDYVHRITENDDLASVVSNASRYSNKSQSSSKVPFSLTSPCVGQLATIPNDEEVDPQPMIERYLRDTNKDICAGIYPPADLSLIVPENDFDGESTTREKHTYFIPWNKRSTFIEATYKPDDENFGRFVRNSKASSSGRFSFRRSRNRTSSIGNDSQKSSKKFTLHRMNSLGRETIRSNRSAASSLKRHNSEIKKRKMSNVSTNSKTSIHVINRHEVVAPAPKSDLSRNVKQRKSNRYKMGCDTRCFFDRYQDNLRVEIFSVKVPTFLSTPPSVDDSLSPSFNDTLTPSEKLSPTTPKSTTTTDSDNTSFFNYTDENLSKEFDYKLVGRTYQQLFYIRSRLSASAKRTEFMCDGIYGCGSNDLHYSSPQCV